MHLVISTISVRSRISGRENPFRVENLAPTINDEGMKRKPGVVAVLGASRLSILGLDLTRVRLLFANLDRRLSGVWPGKAILLRHVELARS